MYPKYLANDRTVPLLCNVVDQDDVNSLFASDKCVSRNPGRSIKITRAAKSSQPKFVCTQSSYQQLLGELSNVQARETTKSKLGKLFEVKIFR